LGPVTAVSDKLPARRVGRHHTSEQFALVGSRASRRARISPILTRPLHGVLTVTVPRSEAEKPHRVEVTSG